jgi:hypothetical protein
MNADTTEEAASLIAAAWALAAHKGKNEATRVLQRVAGEISGSQWQPGGRGR